MSVFLPEGYDAPASDKLVQPSAAPLSDQEKDLIRRLFSKPELIPERFLSYIVDYLAVNQPQIPISNIFGFSQFTAKEGNTISSPTETTTSTSYTDLPTVGPTITGLPDGKYVIFFGNTSSTSSSSAQATTSVKVNSIEASDTDMLLNGSTVTVPVSRAILKTLSNGGNNTLAMRYKVFTAGTGSFRDRWMIALRYANL